MTETAPPARVSRVLAGAVVVHVALTLSHGASHATVPVPVLDWQAVYTAVVVLGAPVAGVVLARRGRLLTGAWIVLVAGTGAVAFEGLLHFVVASQDHVSVAASGSFAATAALSTAGDLLLVVVAGWTLAQERWSVEHGAVAVE